MLYADDLTCIFIYKKPRTMLSQMKKYLKLLEIWFSKWKFKISVNKCCYTIFSNKASSKDRFKIEILNETLKYEEKPTLLGVTFDESLCFKNQVDKIREKCLNRLNLIKILSNKKWKLTKKTLLTLYKSLVGSIIDYSSFMIHELSETNIKKVQSLQNRAVRTIFNQPYDCSTRDLCLIGGLRTIPERLVNLNMRFILKNNSWVSQMVEEYLNSKNAFGSTPTTLSHYV